MQMSKHVTWVEPAAAFPGNISLSSPAIAQAAYILQPFQANVPHVPCTSPHLPVAQQALHKQHLMTQQLLMMHTSGTQG